MSSEPRVIAEFVDYEGMLNGLRARVRELHVHGERFDEFAGIPEGYLSKLIGARPVRRIGMNSLGPLLDGLGIKCIFVENQEATKRLKNRVKPHNPNLVRSQPSIIVTRRMLQRFGRMGAKAKQQNTTPQQRRRIARKAAKARWNKEKPQSDLPSNPAPSDNARAPSKLPARQPTAAKRGPARRR